MLYPRRVATRASTRPAILGGAPAFEQPIRFVRPSVPPLERVVARLRPSYEEGMLTNGRLVRHLEELVAERLGVRHAVAVSCCTSGLMLVLRVLRPSGPVVLPSFTFSASGHAVAWNGLQPVFAECDRQSFQLDVADAQARLRAVDAGALMATHVFGAPCSAEALEAVARGAGIPLVFDAAHGLGATRAERAVGSFGAAEVFSLSPTKVVVAGEGGIVATDDDALAADIVTGRDYGNPGDYDTRFVGLNARMSELHAATAIESLAELDEHLVDRSALAEAYRSALADVPGARCQHVAEGDRSTWKDFTIALDRDFGVSREATVAALRAEGVDTRRYFSPPLHRQTAYADMEGTELPVTDEVAGSVISLPIYRSLSTEQAARVVEVLATIHAHAEEINAAGPP